MYVVGLRHLLNPPWFTSLACGVYYPGRSRKNSVFYLGATSLWHRLLLVALVARLLSLSTSELEIFPQYIHRGSMPDGLDGDSASHRRSAQASESAARVRLYF
ncbi:uncharacterized protein STEHIDRAFT_147835 [Stereum hirsutum FP-91666 SS1]|uniref:uncharacterized protein n=1 Tax=Stereum hirsutum (strain FP-91666) TaxID=721885 RepID=UPI00044498B1|nr:uncharacterized protein STEHIDRAFT_147835 [Stereum hirsutum FP-91666 SS1]EIM85398.1 hypothetical protein STEHIDRAFT_147835 [Stereum hirsutum FP-91666 SS1]